LRHRSTLGSGAIDLFEGRDAAADFIDAVLAERL
jgi:hypothetical protein